MIEIFDSTSRYYSLPFRSKTILDGSGTPREVRYVSRRFIPPAEGMTTILEHQVTEGDRLDNIAARYLGDPIMFWRICDANEAIRPEELTEHPGRRIRIALPKL